MKSYRIGDFAREMGVSADFIKYYEKSDLISPRVDSSNRYRSLTFDQCRRVIEIRKYRNLDFKVGDIEGIINKAGDADILEALEGKRKENESRLVWHRLLDDYFEYVLEVAARRGKGESWYVRSHPAMFFLPHTDRADFIGTQAIRDRFRQWGKYLPLVHSACLTSWEPTDEGSDTAPNARYSYGLCVSDEHARQLDLSLDPPVLTIPAHRCFEYVWDGAFTGNPEGTRDPASEAVTRIARENHFRITGDLLSVFIFPYMKGREYRTIQVFYVPIA